MTGFEHQMLNLRGLAYSYGVDIIFAHRTNKVVLEKECPEKYEGLDTVPVYLSYPYCKGLEPKDYANQMAFEEAIKEFLREYDDLYKKLEEVANDRCINSKRFDLPEM